MVEWKVTDMHCAMCVARIEKAMQQNKLQANVSLADKRVSVDGGEAEAAKAEEILEELGFDAVRI